MMTGSLRISPIRSCALLGGLIVCFGAAPLCHAQLELSSFTLTAAPNPAADGAQVTLTATLTGLS